jgi:hypothetical protein
VQALLYLTFLVPLLRLEGACYVCACVCSMWGWVSLFCARSSPLLVVGATAEARRMCVLSLFCGVMSVLLSPVPLLRQGCCV